MPPTPVTQLAEPYDVDILSGTAVSDGTLLLGGRVVVGVFMPAAWTTAGLSFQAAPVPGGTYVPIVDTSGSEVTYTVGVSTYVAIDPTSFLGVNHLKLRSGTSGTPVNQTADRTLTLMLARPDSQ